MIDSGETKNRHWANISYNSQNELPAGKFKLGNLPGENPSAIQVDNNYPFLEIENFESP